MNKDQKTLVGTVVVLIVLAIGYFLLHNETASQASKKAQQTVPPATPTVSPTTIAEYPISVDYDFSFGNEIESGWAKAVPALYLKQYIKYKVLGGGDSVELGVVNPSFVKLFELKPTIRGKTFKDSYLMNTDWGECVWKWDDKTRGNPDNGYLLAFYPINCPGSVRVITVPIFVQMVWCSGEDGIWICARDGLEVVIYSDHLRFTDYKAKPIHTLWLEEVIRYMRWEGARVPETIQPGVQYTVYK